MGKSLMILLVLASSFSGVSVSHAAMVDKKQVRLKCSTLPYVFDCSIPVVTNTKFGSRCFYLTEGQSNLMKADRRMGFSNEIVSFHLNAGMKVTGIVTEKQTGHQSECEQIEN
jgi:hypothetical protein